MSPITFSAETALAEILVKVMSPSLEICARTSPPLMFVTFKFPIRVSMSTDDVYGTRTRKLTFPTSFLPYYLWRDWLQSCRLNFAVRCWRRVFRDTRKLQLPVYSSLRPWQFLCDLWVECEHFCPPDSFSQIFSVRRFPSNRAQRKKLRSNRKELQFSCTSTRQTDFLVQNSLPKNKI